MPRYFHATSWAMGDDSEIQLNKPYKFYIKKQEGEKVLKYAVITASLDLIREGFALRVLEDASCFDVTGTILFCLYPGHIFDIFWGDIFIFPYSKETSGRQFIKSYKKFYTVM